MIIFAVTCAIISGVSMFSGIWFAVGCHWPIKTVGALTYAIPAIATLIVFCWRYFAPNCMTPLTFTGILTFTLGYIYLVVAMFVNHSNSPQCLTGFPLFLVWTGLVFTVLVPVSPCLIPVFVGFTRWRNRRIWAKERKYCEETCVKLYSSSVDMCHDVAFSKVPHQLRSFLANEIMNDKEIAKVFEVLACVAEQAELEHLPVCCRCSESVKPRKSYLILPGCSHIYCAACFEQHAKNYINCSVCDNRMRRAILHKIHNVPVDDEAPHIF